MSANFQIGRYCKKTLKAFAALINEY